jgi:hypothetical protein
MASHKQKMNWDGIPAEDRAQVKHMVENFSGIPQFCYAVLQESREKKAAKAAAEVEKASKEASELALVSSGALHRRCDDVSMALNLLDGLTELLLLKMETEDNAAQCGIALMREQIRKVDDMLYGLLDPLKDEEAEVAQRYEASAGLRLPATAAE